MSFDEQYRVIESRDPRFDGQFVSAVHSTGIYCRPSCPARTPKRPNVTFYPTSAAAHEAGYRACKRCLPEALRARRSGTCAAMSPRGRCA